MHVDSVAHSFLSMSSSPSPSTALGPRGTRTLTTAPGNQACTVSYALDRGGGLYASSVNEGDVVVVSNNVTWLYSKHPHDICGSLKGCVDRIRDIRSSKLHQPLAVCRDVTVLKADAAAF
eukprot:746106-Hanusia_phi.AAC.1